MKKNFHNCQKCGQDIPRKIIVDGKIKIINSRKFCLQCSPFGRHNTKDITDKQDGVKKCNKCQLIKPYVEFYPRRRPSITETYGPYCKKCTIDDASTRQKSFKQNCLNYKGGKCEICGYNKCNAALEFHHKDPSKKDFTIAHLRSTTLSRRIKLELDKCVILCSNCHREEHSKVSPEGLEPS